MFITSTISLIIKFTKKFFFFKVPQYHFLLNIYFNFLDIFYAYLQKRMVLKGNYIPKIIKHFSNLDEINY